MRKRHTLLVFNIIVCAFTIGSANVDVIFIENELMIDKSCKPGELLSSLSANGTISCLHVCAVQFDSSSVFHNSVTRMCHCCSQIYAVPGGLGSEEGTKYYSTASKSKNVTSSAKSWLIDGHISNCASHVPVQTNFRRYICNISLKQAQILLNHFKVLDKLWSKISFGYDNR